MYILIVRGGPLMWPLLFCSLVSLTISIERGIFWWRVSRRRNERLVENIFGDTEQGDFDGALSIGNATFDFAARVLASGLAHRDYGLTESMQVAAEDEIARMKRGLSVLDTIITMAPLLGILGTVLGIIESFDLLGMSGIEDPKAVTGGIAQALITTATGLSVALVTLVPFNYLVSKVQRATKHLENITTRFEVAYRKGLERNHAS
jgi:biopolymer transport protein ExbB